MMPLFQSRMLKATTIMANRYVVDTSALISFHHEVFRYAQNYVGSDKLTPKARTILNHGIDEYRPDVLLIIPSIVFIEVYEKWLTNEEFQGRFFYEVFVPLRDAEHVEIREIDREVLERLILIRGSLTNHDLHDKLIVATAEVLEAPLVTTDQRITDYVSETDLIPGTLS